MKLITAEKKRAKIKMCISGPSGSGKTYSSLLLANGLSPDYQNIAVLDTESGSSHLYAHLGPYKIVSIEAPYTPEKYIEAIDLCISSGMEVIIIDSLSHEWEYLLEYHSSLPGNSFTAWGKVTPRHQTLIQKILSAPLHIIATTRTKTEYVLADKNGKMVPEKVGMKIVQRDGLDYEFTLVLDLDIRHNAIASKDRTGLFIDKHEFKITPAAGLQIANWGMDDLGSNVERIKGLINSSNTSSDLLELYNKYPEYRGILLPSFERRKQEIITSQKLISNKQLEHEHR